jgi:hypothetical protein
LVECVIDPSSFAPINEQAGILEDLEMEREARLSVIQGILQIADTLLALRQEVEKLEAGFVGQGMKDLCGTPEIFGSDIRHEGTIHQRILISQES